MIIKLKPGHIVKYANLLATIVTSSNKSLNLTISIDGNERIVNIEELEGILISDKILKNIGFTNQLNKNIYSLILPQNTDESNIKCGNSKIELVLGYNNGVIEFSVYHRMIKNSRNLIAIMPNVKYLHELQDAFNVIGYKIPITEDAISYLQKCLFE